jgi:hypothetical protein
VNDATLTATITAPGGTSLSLPLEWSLRDDGTYTGSFVATDSGRYTVDASARRSRVAMTASVAVASIPRDTLQSSRTTLLVDDHGADMAQAELRVPLLKRIATETGGRYYPLADAQRLADDVIYTESGVTVREAKDLWDMPVVFLLLALLLSAEWSYRRWRGLA